MSYNRHVAMRKPTIGILANIYEESVGIHAGGHLHFVEVVKRWKNVDLVLFAPRIARTDLMKALPQARFVTMPAAPSAVGKALDFLFRSLFAALRFRELRSCDAMLATSQSLVDVAPLVISGKPSAIIIHHLIGTEFGRNPRELSIPVLSERFSLWATRFGNVRACITSSRLVAEELRLRGLTIPMVVSTNGIDHIAQPGQVDISSSERCGAVFVGRLHPSKNIDDAIRAWKIVVARVPDARLTIVGRPTSPAYLSTLRSLIIDLDLNDRVFLTGAISDAEKSNALARAKFFFFPSGLEGWGIAIAEAMRAGLPCITYDLPIFAEIFPTGRLWAPLRDYEALAERAIELLVDERSRLRYASEALALSRTFSWERASAITRDVFASIA